MQDISLISKSQKEQGIPRIGAFKKSDGGIPPLTKIAIVLIIVTAAAYGGLFAWEKGVQAKISNLEDERKAVLAERDAALETRVKNLSSLIEAFENLVSQHRNWSRLFSLIQNETLPETRLTSFEGVYGTNTFSVTGHVPNYLTLAQQIKAYEASDHIFTIQTEGVQLSDEGDVEFTLSIQFNRDVVNGIPSDTALPQQTGTTSPIQQ